MKYFKAAGQLMRFDALDSSGDAFPTYTVGWRIKDEPDVWTNRFLGYKDSRLGYGRGGAKLLLAAFEELIRVAELDPAKVVLATAFGHAATGPNPKSILHLTGEHIAQQTGVEWFPQLFAKKAHNSLRFAGDGASRDAEVNGKYWSGTVAKGTTVVILDDFVTRGATLGDMHRALQEACPNTPMIALALGKNETASYGRFCNLPVNNDHIPAEWGQLWQAEHDKALKK
ncbi:phosphoribosyltransferase [Brevundimonas diminuta]|uniref:phosphoribosyltransferase n=1 Tax=Brevundimonas diminuta TaxID=293 RepID=UPI0022AEEBFA|nr:phosphoribosyltransferase [Brevundimonas diminuta]MCZ4107925.1 phosphoribosyltransferase [Brevundimonas diminuta]